MTGHPASFIDGDGSINYDSGYAYRIADFVFRDGILDLGNVAEDRGIVIDVVIKEAGRGRYAQSGIRALADLVLSHSAEIGVNIAGVEHRPHHPLHGVEGSRRECPQGKPGPGMILDACALHGLDRAASVMAGDKATDIEAAVRPSMVAPLLPTRSVERSAAAMPGMRLRPDGAHRQAAEDPAGLPIFEVNAVW